MKKDIAIKKPFYIKVLAHSKRMFARLKATIPYVVLAGLALLILYSLTF